MWSLLHCRVELSDGVGQGSVAYRHYRTVCSAAGQLEVWQRSCMLLLDEVASTAVGQLQSSVAAATGWSLSG